jgi:arginyl-tRNA synthetase
MMTHKSLIHLLRLRFAEGVTRVTDAACALADTLIRPTNDPRFGDYQCNAAMPLAKSLKGKPRDIAQQIISAVDLDDVAEPLEIAGPGFINIRLRPEFVATFLSEIPAPPADTPGAAPAPDADRLGIPTIEQPQKVIIDYSSPNIAKQMHVGHLRSTIIGDVFARVLGFLGHDVVRQNHVGDWGTAMGMVILGLWYIKACTLRGETIEHVTSRLKALLAAKDETAEARRALIEPICAQWSADLREDIPPGLEVGIEQLERGYQFVQALTTVSRGLSCQVTMPNGSSDDIAELPRKVTAMLQRGGKPNKHERQEWNEACTISLEYCQRLYERLGVLLRNEDVCGESFYDARLAPVVEELTERLAAQASQTSGAHVELRTDDGAQCLYFYDENNSPRFKNQDGDELPMIIRKSDGAFLYATTDLAAIRYRIEELEGRRLIYVTDARQKLHFHMLFAAARAAGWACDDVTLEHVTFGSVLGDDRRPLKTRDGENVKLSELLDEAERRALALVEQKDRERSHEATEPRSHEGEESAGGSPFSPDQRHEIARRVGIAAVKYADLSRDRNSDYVFSWDQMLAMQGNTAPYMMYAYARIRSIYRKAADEFGAPDVYAANVAISLTEPAERALGLRLARFPEVIEQVAAELAPHTLCNYLYELASEFMRFYEDCPVLRAPDEPTRLSRMRLCDLTARTLSLALQLLGIRVIDRM